MLKPLTVLFTAVTVGVSAPVISVLPGDTQVDISWKAPSAPVDFVLIEESTNAGATWRQIDKLPGTALHYLAESLTNGTNYWYRVRWMTNGIPSSPSQAVVVQPDGQPDIPTSLIAVAGDGEASLQWDAAPESAKIVGYAIEASENGGDLWRYITKDTGGPSNRYLVEGLTNGIDYSFRVKAIAYNRIDSEWSDSASTLIGVLKDGSFELVGDISGSMVNLTWGEPGLNSTIDLYRIEISTDGGMTWSTAKEVDGTVKQSKLAYVLGGALYRVVATSVNGEQAVSIENLVQTLADAQDSPFPVGSNTTGSDQTNTQGNSAETGTDPAVIRGGVGSRETLPAFDPRNSPQSTSYLSIAAVAVLGLFTGGLTFSRRRREGALDLLDGIGYESPESFDNFDEYGDRSRSWRLPTLRWTQRVERITHAVASQVNRFSPFAANSILDGSYLRAMYGGLSPLTWIAGALFATLALFETHGQALAPKTLTVVALLLITCLDAGAGLFSVLIILLGTAIFGGIESLAALHTTIALSLLWIAPTFIARTVRPFRRERPEYDDENPKVHRRYQWERAADYILGPGLSALAVYALIKTLPGISGLVLPIAQNALVISLATFLFLLLRYGLEENATKSFPMRLLMVEDHDLKEPIAGQALISVLVRTVLFIFVAQPFMSTSWQLALGTILVAAPSLIRLFVKDYSVNRIVKIVSTEIAKLVVALIIAAVLIFTAIFSTQ